MEIDLAILECGVLICQCKVCELSCVEGVMCVQSVVHDGNWTCYNKFDHVGGESVGTSVVYISYCNAYFQCGCNLENEC